jgi:hypothetical protein
MGCCGYGMAKLEKRLKRLEREVRLIRFLVSRPHSVTKVTVGESDMAIKFAVVLPEPPVGPDWREIAYGRLTVQIGTADPFSIVTEKRVQEAEPRQVTDDRFVGPQGAAVQLTFAYIDDAGNVGTAVAGGGTLEDTVPPVAPSSVGLVATEEIAEEDIIAPAPE